MRPSFYPFAIAFATIILTACNKSLSEIERVELADPIQPIHLKGDTTHIVLADYVPTIDSFDMVGWNGYEIAPVGKELELFHGPDSIFGRAVGALFLQQGEQYVSVAVLPPYPYKAGLYTQKGNKEEITIAFTETPKHPTFVVFWQNMYVWFPKWKKNDDGTWTLHIANSLKKTEGIRQIKGRSFLRIYATDDDVLYNDLLIPLEDMEPVLETRQLTRHDNQAQVLYSLMVDRFENGNTANDKKVGGEVMDIVDYQGGDIAGIKKKIEDGYFDELGVNTLWVSPLSQNPEDAWGKYVFKNGNKYDSTRLYTRFSGYHGYWPIYNTKLDNRMGTEDELHEMLRVAHKHDMNVVLDYVANHLHISSPTLVEHPDWMTDSILPDGRRNFELWDEQRLTTWFDVHIPTLDLEREEVSDAMTDSALVWLDKFAFDGYRHDACKHIPNSYWRMFVKKMKQRYPDRHLWMIGETYGSSELIGNYVKTGMLDAQFDFNVYYTIINTLVREDGSMEDINKVILESQNAYGSHHTMGNISGNHDNARFVSLAGRALDMSEDAKEAGWTREVGVGDTAIAYKKALLLEVINMTIPGVPCIYQGDEYAQAGGNDPDNRHMMRFDGLSQEEQVYKEKVKELIQTRRKSMALLYGEYIPIEATKDLLVYERVYMGERIRIEIDKSTLEYRITRN